jgi:hypothetical protein
MMGHGEQGLTGLILAVAGAGAGAPTLPIPLDSYTDFVGAITDHEDLFGADPAHAPSARRRCAWAARARGAYREIKDDGAEWHELQVLQRRG